MHVFKSFSQNYGKSQISCGDIEIAKHKLGKLIFSAEKNDILIFTGILELFKRDKGNKVILYVQQTGTEGSKVTN